MSVLVIAPHPDDETLGCGGTIAALAAADVDVYVIAVACHAANTGDVESELPPDRAQEFANACKTLGVTGFEIAFHHDAHRTLFEQQAQLVTMFERECAYAIDRVLPDTVILPASGSFHQDHQVVHHAAFAACRPRGKGRHTPRNVLGYCGPEEEWRPQARRSSVYIDITQVQERKFEALKAYEFQLRMPPHPRSLETIRALDAVNGARFGVGAAEVFTPYRLDMHGLLRFTGSGR